MYYRLSLGALRGDLSPALGVELLELFPEVPENRLDDVALLVCFGLHELVLELLDVVEDLALEVERHRVVEVLLVLALDLDLLHGAAVCRIERGGVSKGEVSDRLEE